jgi:hypothetical protein
MSFPLLGRKMSSRTIMREALPKCYHTFLVLRLLAEHSPRYASTFYREICGGQHDYDNCTRAVRGVLERLERHGILYKKRERGTWRWVWGLTSDGKKLVSELFLEAKPS